METGGTLIFCTLTLVTKTEPTPKLEQPLFKVRFWVHVSCILYSNQQFMMCTSARVHMTKNDQGAARFAYAGARTVHWMLIACFKYI